MQDRQVQLQKLRAQAYQSSFFVPRSDFSELEELLHEEGGTYAVRGPRGVGKSWLVREIIKEAKEKLGGVGLWCRAPSKYEPENFLATLLENFADEVHKAVPRVARERATLATRFQRLTFNTTLLDVSVRILILLILASAGAWSWLAIDRLLPESAGAAWQWILVAAPWLVLGILSVYFLYFNELDFFYGGVFRTFAKWSESKRQLLVGISLLLIVIAIVGASAAQLWRSVDESASPEVAVAGISTAAAAALGLLGAMIFITTTLVAAEWNAYEKATTRRELSNLDDRAQTDRDRIRYSITLRSSTEISAGISRWVSAAFRLSRGKELVERPFSSASLESEFRYLVKETASKLEGQIIIGLDELDSISDADAARALLRDLKGIFTGPKVHLLVLLSDDTAPSLGLGTRAGQDVFNGELRVRPFRPKESAKLINSRIKVEPNDSSPEFPDDVGRALGVLSGGRPREITRLTEPVLQAADSELLFSNKGVAAAVAALVRVEAMTFRREVLGSRLIRADIKTHVFEFLSETKFDPDQLPTHAEIQKSTWSITGVPGPATDPNEGWDEEAWQRLVIRIKVAGIMAKEPGRLVGDDGFDDLLQEVINVSDQSAEGAWTLLNYIGSLPLTDPDPPG